MTHIVVWTFGVAGDFITDVPNDPYSCLDHNIKCVQFMWYAEGLVCSPHYPMCYYPVAKCILYLVWTQTVAKYTCSFECLVSIMVVHSRRRYAWENTKCSHHVA